MDSLAVVSHMCYNILCISDSSFKRYTKANCRHTIPYVTNLWESAGHQTQRIVAVSLKGWLRPEFQSLLKAYKNNVKLSKCFTGSITFTEEGAKCITLFAQYDVQLATVKHVRQTDTMEIQIPRCKK